MRSNIQQTSRRRRGGRRHRNDGSSRNYSDSGKTSTPVKLGFFERIIAFFTGGSKKAGSKSTAKKVQTTEIKLNGSKENRKAEPQTTRIIRKPELVEVTSSKLYVGNLSFDATEGDLNELFAGVGSVEKAEVVSHRETQKSKGFAFVTLGTVDEAKRAVTELHDKEFMGRRLVVSGAKTSDVRNAR
jgi:RNA recognition motif-containing protein